MRFTHAVLTDETREQAALYVLGALDPADAAAFGHHLTAGCAVCEAEVRALEAATGDLGLAAPPAEPPAELRQRLLARVSASPASAADPGILLKQAGLLIASSERMSWQPQEIRGLSMKVLFTDSARKYVTALARLEPGAQYPPHRHADIEELYVLEGDLIVEGQVMRPGDYCRAEPESLHGLTRTRNGCLFLVRSSERDELLDSASPA